MPTGLEIYKEDGSVLLSTDNIKYGLLKSGYLTLTDRWSWWLYKTGTDPNDESSYLQMDPGSPIWSISVVGATAPVAFTCGRCSISGVDRVGNTTTFYYTSVNPSTNVKVYIFDLMKDRGERVGMQCFNAQGVLTFTTAMPSLNIVGVSSPPPQPPPFQWGNELRYGVAYSGGTSVRIGRELAETDYYNMYSYVDVPASTGEVAARITFSRACGILQGRDFGYYSVAGVECASGKIGTSGIQWAFTGSATSTVAFTTDGPVLINIPQDRIPQAVYINTSEYPFPFN